MIYENLVKIGALLEKRASAVASTVSGLSYSEIRLLSALESGPLTRATLAEAIGLTPSAVSRALQPLEKLGFVMSARDGRDARQSRASLTDAGAERLAHAQQAVSDAWQALELDLGSIDDASLEHVLAQLTQPRKPVFGNRPRPASAQNASPAAGVPRRPGIQIS